MYSDYSGMEGLPGSLPPTVLMSNSFVLLKYTTTTFFVLPVVHSLVPVLGCGIDAPQRCLDENFLISIWGNGRSHGKGGK